MVQGTNTAAITVSQLMAIGAADEWLRPADRIDVPDMMEGEPSPGRRARYQLGEDGGKGIYARMEDAIERAPRFRGQAIFQVDNAGKTANYEQLMAHTDPAVKWNWVSSGLGVHATAMFLDDRPMMVQLRIWFRELTTESQKP